MAEPAQTIAETVAASGSDSLSEETLAVRRSSSEHD
jgi:hypothetical protein